MEHKLTLSYYNQKQILLEEIKSNLNRSYLHKNWFDVLKLWLIRFDGFIYDYTGNPADELIIYESMEQITKYQDLCDDSVLMHRVVNEFEGLHWTSACYRANRSPEFWSSIQEPYYAFKARFINHTLDHLVLVDKHATIEESITWISQMLECNE